MQKVYYKMNWLSTLLLQVKLNQQKFQKNKKVPFLLRNRLQLRKEMKSGQSPDDKINRFSNK